jgi:hypothetical protein
LGKTIFKCVKCKITRKKNIQDPVHQMSSNLHRSFLFKCRNEFHIILWPLVKGWGNNKENYFCGWLHGEISQYYSGERCGPSASCYFSYCLFMQIVFCNSVFPSCLQLFYALLFHQKLHFVSVHCSRPRGAEVRAAA